MYTIENQPLIIFLFIYESVKAEYIITISRVKYHYKYILKLRNNFVQEDNEDIDSVNIVQ